MRRIFALLALAAILIPIQPARAQSNVRLFSALVKVWPEYDEPSVLVIYQIVVAPQTSLPAQMTFRIPKSAAKPHVVAVGDTLENVSDQDISFFFEENAEWVNVTVQVTGPAIQLEYYDPALLINGTQRTFTFTWPGDYAVQNFSVELQQPFDASAVTSAPELPNVNSIPEGLTYFMGDFGALAQGEEFALDVSYQKASDALSVSFMNVQPSAPIDESTAGRVSLDAYLPWVVGSLGVLLIAGGAYYYYRSAAPVRSSARRRHASSAEKEGEQVYCSQCGTRARGGDRFCRTCGARLRADAE